jgi:AcrR family transcriptional regulator
MSQKPKKINRQILRTRSWILEAVMLLMDEKPYAKITASEIIEKAGIARQTFYRNYNNKDDVLFDYLQNSINTELLKFENYARKDKQDMIVLSFNYDYMVKNSKNLKKILSVPDIESRMIHDIQQLPIALIEHYKKKLSPDDYLVCRYKICYQIIGSLRIFFDWFINDMPMPIDLLIVMLNAMNTPKIIQYRHIPGIIIRVDTNNTPKRTMYRLAKN